MNTMARAGATSSILKPACVAWLIPQKMSGLSSSRHNPMNTTAKAEHTGSTLKPASPNLTPAANIY